MRDRLYKYNPFHYVSGQLKRVMITLHFVTSSLGIESLGEIFQVEHDRPQKPLLPIVLALLLLITEPSKVSGRNFAASEAFLISSSRRLSREPRISILTSVDNFADVLAGLEVMIRCLKRDALGFLHIVVELIVPP
jgi:hypothetical protein